MDTVPPLGAVPPAPRPGWWSRNWKWFVPTGCLAFLGLIAAFVACIVFFVFGLMKSSDVYKTSVERAKANSEVRAALGTPIEEGWFVTGQTNATGASGNANLAIPISGPKGKATIYAVAEKSAGEWNYSKLVVELAETKERIDLENAPE